MMPQSMAGRSSGREVSRREAAKRIKEGHSWKARQYARMVLSEWR